LELIVSDIVAARDDLIRRGVELAVFRNLSTKAVGRPMTLSHPSVSALSAAASVAAPGRQSNS
jgi:hypothetical protein